MDRGKKREEEMEIAPIPGIRAVPAVRAPQADFRPPEVGDIEGAARPGEGEEHRQNRKAQGAEEEEQDDIMLDAEADSSGQHDESSPRIDYFV